MNQTRHSEHSSGRTVMGKMSFLWIVLLFFRPDPAAAQRWNPEGNEEGSRTWLMYTPLALRGDSAHGARVDIIYRVDEQFFVGVRPTDFNTHGSFEKEGELMFELVDSTGTSVARVIEQISVQTPSVQPEENEHHWYQGLASLSAPPGKYRILTELTDLQSKRRFTERWKDVRVPAPDRTQAVISAATFVDGTFTTAIPDTLTPTNFGDDFLFGRPAALLFELPATMNTDSLVADYSFAVEDLFRDDDTVPDRTKGAKVICRIHAALKPVPLSSPPRYSVVASPSTTVALLPLPMEKLDLRTFRFQLNVHNATEADSLHHRVRALWPDMPSSLRDIRLALESLRFLVPENRVSRMRRGDYTTQRDSLEAFWKPRDPSPGTAFNELEAEYYKRVDHAIRSFATLRQPDGSRSDRGKTYILFGPPTSTERSLNPEGPFTEVWTYAKLGKRFLFQDQKRTGEYVLVNQSTL